MTVNLAQKSNRPEVVPVLSIVRLNVSSWAFPMLFDSVSNSRRQALRQQLTKDPRVKWRGPRRLEMCVMILPF